MIDTCEQTEICMRNIKYIEIWTDKDRYEQIKMDR